MGLFDKLFSKAENAFSYSPINKQEAWVAIVYASARIDGEVSDAEIEAMMKALMYKRMYQGHEVMDYFRSVVAALQKLNPKQILDASFSQVDVDDAPTLFSIVCETLLSDGLLEKDEQEIIEYIASGLHLEESIASMIIEAMLIRNKGNLVFID